jgi:hypothetical protein
MVDDHGVIVLMTKKTLKLGLHKLVLIIIVTRIKIFHNVFFTSQKFEFMYFLKY